MQIHVLVLYSLLYFNTRVKPFWKIGKGGRPDTNKHVGLIKRPIKLAEAEIYDVDNNDIYKIFFYF